MMRSGEHARRRGLEARQAPGPLLHTFVLAMLLLSGAGCGPTHQILVEPPREDPSMLESIPQPTSFETAGGLRVLVQHADAAPVVAIQFWVRTGSADEDEREAGLAHVHEHMLFKGTARRATGEIARQIESMGGNINAWTSFDETVYHVVAPARFFDEALDVLSDALQHSAFDPDELAAELVVIDEEIRRGLDQPSRALNQAIFERAFPRHPYGRPIIGTPETVASFTRDDVLRFYERWYRPQNTTLVIVGDVDEATVRASVERHLGRWAASPVERPVRPSDPPAEGLATVVVEREVQHGTVSFAFRGLAASDDDVAAFDLLTTLAGQGESSVLFERLQRERGIVDGVWSYSYTPRDPGLVLFGAAFGSSRLHAAGALEVVEAMAREVAHLRYRDFTASEVRRARTQLESETIFQRRTVQGIARRLGYFQTLADDVEFERSYYRRLARVTPAELARVATEYLSPERLTAGLLLPPGTGVSEAQLEATIRDAFASVEAAYRREVPVAEPNGVVRTVLPGGTLLLIRPERSAPIFSVRAAALGGVLADPGGRLGRSRMVADLLTSGTGRFSASELAERVESMAASMSGFSGNNSLGLAMTALASDLPEALDLFVDALLYSNFPASEVERVRREAVHGLDASQENPTARVMELFTERVYRGHPYGAGRDDLRAGLTRVTRDDIVVAHRELIRPDRLVIAVAGDVDPRVVIERFTTLLDAHHEAPGPAVVRPAPPARSVEDRQRSLRMEREQSQIVLGFPTVPDTHPDAHALDVVAAILGGQSGRLFMELRDRRSLAYSVGAYHSAVWGGGAFYLYIATSPAREDEALAALREQLARLRHEGITDDELQRAKRLLLGRRDIALQSQGHRVASLTQDELYGHGFGWSDAWPDRIEAVDAAAIRGAVERWLDPQFEIEAVVSPLAAPGDMPALDPEAGEEVSD